MTKDGIRLILAASGALLALASSADIERLGSWPVRLPANVLQRLPMAQRTCAENAERQTERGSYRAAAAEWARFDTEFVSAAGETALAWAMTMRARCLQRAKDVNKALELYSDEIELYPEEPATACALFWRASAEAGNGHVEKAAADLAEVTGNDAFARTPVRYAAADLEAQQLVRGGKFAEAKALWQQVKDAPRDVNAGSWDAVKETLARLARLEKPAQAIADGTRAYQDILNRINWNDEVTMGYFAANRRGAKDARAAADAWKREAADLFVKKLTDAIAAAKDPAERDARAAEAVNALADMRRIDEAKKILPEIADPVRRAFAGAHVGWVAGDGKFVAFSLEDAEKSSDPETAARAKREHASACQRLLRDWETAIRLYGEAPNPPETLWRTAECERAAGRPAKAQAILDEICGVFPEQAADAMLRKGDWYRDDKDRARAIGCYRRLMQHADWKKSRAASEAHQRLEAYGIATGGAVLNETR